MTSKTLLQHHGLEWIHGALTMDGVPLEDIAQKYGTPTYVYSRASLDQSILKLKEALSGLDACVCFAVKANANPLLLAQIAAHGLGADLVSGGELLLAEAAGFPAHMRVFSGVGKQDWEMQLALEKGIHSFNVESLAELRQLDLLAAKLSRHSVKVALRFNPDVNAKTHPYISTGLKENKFGLNRKEILELFQTRAHYPHLSFSGLSIHIGSQLLSLQPLADAFDLTARLREEIRKKSGAVLEFIDLGGGLGIQYRNERPPSLDRYVALIQRYFPKTQIYLEPGRSLIGNTGLLLSRTILTKTRDRKTFVVIDAAMNDLLRPALYGSYHEIVPVRPRGRSIQKYEIVGPVCETSDRFAKGRPLKSRIEEGDLLALLSAGAYGYSMSSQYNARPRPAEVQTDRGKATLIRSRETLEELLAQGRVSIPNRGL
jgi:diaminopimelate decarboxylase